MPGLWSLDGSHFVCGRPGQEWGEEEELRYDEFSLLPGLTTVTGTITRPLVWCPTARLGKDLEAFGNSRLNEWRQEIIGGYDLRRGVMATPLDRRASRSSGNRSPARTAMIYRVAVLAPAASHDDRSPLARRLLFS